MKTLTAFLCVALSYCAFAADAPARRSVGRPASDVFGSPYMRTFFPPGSDRLDSITLKPGEVRIRIVHRNLARSIPTPSSKGVAAEISGILGRSAAVLADHDHEGFEWRKTVLAESEFQALAAAVLDGSFLSLKPVKPIGLGSRAFHIEVVTETVYGCFFADWLDAPEDADRRTAFRRVAATIMKAAGFEEREVFW